MVKYPVSTQKTESGHGVYVGWLNALLFSLNVALLFVPIISLRMKYPILMIGRRIFYFVSAHWPIQIPSAVREADPNRLGFATLVLSFAALLCVLLLVTAQLRLVAKFLRVVPGIMAVAGFPAYIKLLQGIPVALYAEIVAASVCVLLYAYGKWKLPSFVGILLLGLHFAFWFWGTPFQIWSGYPLIGFCSAVVWAIFLKQSEQSPNPQAR
jgi:hypothetical protein